MYKLLLPLYSDKSANILKEDGALFCGQPVRAIGSIDYGTAGFRTHSDNPALWRAVFRCSLLAAIRSQVLGGKAIGVSAIL